MTSIRADELPHDVLRRDDDCGIEGRPIRGHQECPSKLPDRLLGSSGSVWGVLMVRDELDPLWENRSSKPISKILPLWCVRSGGLTKKLLLFWSMGSLHDGNQVDRVKLEECSSSVGRMEKSRLVESRKKETEQEEHVGLTGA